MFTSLRLHAFCAGGFEQKIGKCLNQALEIRRRRPLGTGMFQIQSELHRNAAFPFLSHGLSPSSEDDRGKLIQAANADLSWAKRHACAIALTQHLVPEFAAMATPLLRKNALQVVAAPERRYLQRSPPPHGAVQHKG